MYICDFYGEEIKEYPQDCDKKGCTRRKNKLTCKHLSEHKNSCDCPICDRIIQKQMREGMEAMNDTLPARKA